MEALSKIKQVSKQDLHRFLQSDHRDFNVLSVSFKQILSTQRTHVVVSKNSAKSFYLKDKSKPKLTQPKPTLPSDCRKDAQNCQYFALFSSVELWRAFVKDGKVILGIDKFNRLLLDYSLLQVF